MLSFKLMNLDHVQLAMPPGGDGQAREFYSGLLGIPEVEKPEPLRSGAGAWFERGALRIHLGVDDNFHSAKKAHPAFTVSGLLVLEKRLIAAGHKVKRAAPLDGRARFHAYDPFGNRLEFIEASDA